MTKLTEAELLAAAVAADPSVPTMSQQLENSRRIAGDNSELFRIAEGAVNELRELAKVWKTATMSKYQIDQILDRYDSKIKEAIK